MKLISTRFAVCLLCSGAVFAADNLPPKTTPETTTPTTSAQEPANTAIPSTTVAPPVEVERSQFADYQLSPGDALEITVWKEEGLQKEQILISPDGNIIFPLVGTVTAAGKTISELRDKLTSRLADYIADPSISVKLMGNQGNVVFVIGKVNKPGMVNAGRRVDVLQALSLAGGLTVFADDSNISVQRRTGNEIKVFPFDYSNVIDGDDLHENILLEPGDTVTVP